MRKPILLALSLLGLFDALYLWWAYTSSSRPMVCVGGGCDVVRASSYAHFAGLPLPVFGAAMYAALAVILFVEPLLAGPMARLGHGAVAGISGVGFLVSLGLTGVEALVLHAWCAWCVVSAITVTLIFALAVFESLRADAAADASLRLAAIRKNLAVTLGAIVMGAPAFVVLTRQNALPPPKAAPPATLEARLLRSDTHFYGDPQAALTVVEFGDFQCPYCAQAEDAAEEVRQRFGDRIRFAFRQFPITALHAYAEKAAEASECAAQQGKFWPAVDFLYKHQEDLSVPALHRYAVELGLNQAAFDRCLDGGEMASRVRQDQQDGRAIGVSRVPTFFIGHTMIEGAMEYPRFAEIIEQQLENAGAGSAPVASAARPPAPTPLKKKNESNPSATSKSAMDSQTSGFPAGGLAAPSGGTNIFTKLQGSTAGCSEDEAKQKQPELIGTAEAGALAKKGGSTLFVDVRTVDKFASGHIPNAVNLPSDDFTQQWKKLPRGKTIVLYQGGLDSGDICAASRAAGRILLSQGFSQQKVKVFQPGLAGWKKAGLPIQH